VGAVSVFLFSDIEGSTALWSAGTAAMSEALRAHDELVREATAAGSGIIVKHTGDGFIARFESPNEAIEAAVEVQRALPGKLSTREVVLRCRMAVHAGEAEHRDADWFGPPMNRAARLMALAHGGQILVSGVIAGLIGDCPPPDCALLDLGIHQLRDIATPEHVFQVVASGLASEFPPLNSGGSTGSRVPVRLSSFIGRAVEVALGRQMIAERRLVSLVGPGGIGKTSLAREIVVGLEPGAMAWWVDLTVVGGVDDVASAVAVVVDARDGQAGNALDRLVARMRDERGLLVLDNCEHVLGGVGLVVDTLLASAPGVRVLATSREPLALDGERLWRLGPLPVPSSGSPLAVAAGAESVELFVERARQGGSDFALTPANRDEVVELCRRLDGIPLALELAAARTSHVSLGELLASLERRFPLLRDGRRNAPARHRTLSASLQWSYDMLTVDEQRLLCAAAVFVGPFTAAAVASVADDHDGDVVEGMSRLVDRSLLDLDVHRGRYRMLETVREFGLAAAEDTGWLEELRDRHLAWCLGLAARWNAGRVVLTPDAVEDVLREQSNLLAALSWSCEPGRRPAVELVPALAAAAVGQQLGADTHTWTSRLLVALEHRDEALWAQAVGACARVRMEIGDTEFVEQTIPRAVAIARRQEDAATEAACTMALGTAAFVAGVPGWSDELRRAGASAAILGLPALELEARVWLGWALACNGQAAEAEEQLARCDELGVLDSVHATQCAVARYIEGTWRGELLGSDGLPAAGGPFVWWASALRALYTGDPLGAGLSSVPAPDQLPGYLAAMARSATALISLLADGDLGAARREAAAAAGERWFGKPLFPMVWLAATLALADGDVESARAYTDAADAVAAPDGWGPVGVAMLRSEIALHDDDHAGAEKAVIDTLEVTLHQGLRPWICDLLEQLAYADAAAGRADRVGTLIGSVSRARESMGYRYRLAHRQARWEVVAGPLVDSAACADGANRAIEEVAGWVRRGRGRRVRPQAGWAALTPTEVVVVAHVSDGLTNAEIAERMFVSPATVKSHLEHVYAKLQVRGRVELIANATRQIVRH
jgi:predicted ATPase/class 3 adenylate cyclase/DNA-binding CsgD family transcriptional regulator